MKCNATIWTTDIFQIWHLINEQGMYGKAWEAEDKYYNS